MDGFIKVSTSHTFQFGPFIDDSDGKTAETGLTIAYTDVYLSKNGGAAAAKNDTTNLTGTGDSRGYYDCVLNTTDTGTTGTLKVMCHVSGALPVWATFQVVNAVAYESIFSDDGDDYLQVDVKQVGSTAQTAGDVTALVNTLDGVADGIETHVHQIDSRVLGTVAAGTHNAQTGDAYAIVNNGTYGNSALNTDIDVLLTRIVGTLAAGTHNAQSGDAYAVVNSGTFGNSALKTLIDAIQADIGDASGGTLGSIYAILGNAATTLLSQIQTIDTNVDSVLDDTGSAGVVVASGSKTGYSISGTKQTLDALNDITVANVWDHSGAITSLGVELLLERIYEMINNKMTVNETSGNVALRNLADGADIATGNVASASGTTTRAVLTWA